MKSWEKRRYPNCGVSVLSRKGHNNHNRDFIFVYALPFLVVFYMFFRKVFLLLGSAEPKIVGKMELFTDPLNWIFTMFVIISGMVTGAFIPWFWGCWTLLMIFILRLLRVNSGRRRPWRLSFGGHHTSENKASPQGAKQEVRRWSTSMKYACPHLQAQVLAHPHTAGTKSKCH